MKFEVLIKIKMQKIMTFLLSNSDIVVFIMLINIKMPTIVGNLAFMSRINFVPCMKKVNNLGPDHTDDRGLC